MAERLLPCLDIDQLRTFIAIGDVGSFTNAAHHLNKTQSAVSMQMQRLETVLGVTLFEKMGRLNRLTPEGQRLADYARRMLALNSEVIGAFKTGRMTGYVRLGGPFYAEHYFGLLITRFVAKNPGIEIEFTSKESRRLARDIDRGTLDLAVVTHKSAGSIGEVVSRNRLHWVGGAAHPGLTGEPVCLALYHPSSALRTIAVMALQKAGIPFHIAITSSSTEALVAAVLNNFAVSMLPQSAITARMRVLDESHGFPSLPTMDMALLRSAGADAPYVDMLADFISTELAKEQTEVGPSWQLAARP